MQPEAMALMRIFADSLEIPRILALAVGYGENGLNLDGVGDNGLAAGILQVRTDAHGHEVAYWSGLDGAGRSLAEMRGRWARAAHTLGITPASTVDVPLFAAFWKAAQGADPAGVDARAAQVLRDTEALFPSLAASPPTQGPTTMQKPPIVWKPAAANNYTAGRPAGVNYEGICIHTTGGGASIAALDSWFQNPDQQGNGSRGVATSFAVGPGGEIHQYVSLTNTAHAHGVLQNPTARMVLDNGTLNPNTYLIGIEHVDGGVPGTVTDAQFEASAQLAAWLFQSELLPHAADTGCTVSRDRVIGHYQIEAQDRAHCPSWPEERFAAYLTRIRQLLAGQVSPPQPVDPRVQTALEGFGMARKGLTDLQASVNAQISAQIAGIDAVVQRLAA